VAVMVGAVVALIAVGVAAFIATAGSGKPTMKVQAAPAQPDAPDSAFVRPAPQGIDPTDEIARMRNKLPQPHQNAKLLSIDIKNAHDGLVPMQPTSGLVFRLLTESSLNKGRKTLEVSPPYANVAEKDPDLTTTAIGDPLCVWSAAWRSLLASGVPKDTTFNVRYIWNKDRRKPTWEFTSEQHSEHNRTLDGMTCAIQTN
jgi:hypothetical protein